MKSEYCTIRIKREYKQLFNLRAAQVSRKTGDYMEDAALIEMENAGVLKTFYETLGYQDYLEKIMKKSFEAANIQALELWRKLLLIKDDPWATGGFDCDDYYCFFCDESRDAIPNHTPNCVYIAAKELLENTTVNTVTQ